MKETMILIHSTWKLSFQEHIGQLGTIIKLAYPLLSVEQETRHQHVWLGMLPTGDVNGYIQPFDYFLSLYVWGLFTI